MRATLVLTSSLFLAATARAENPFVIEADLQPRVQAGRIVIDAIDHTSQQVISNVRTFGWEFGEGLDPYLIQDPGFDVEADSGLPAGSQVGFNVSQNLLYWPGGASVSFGGTAGGESLHLNFGGGTVSIAAHSPPQSGFNFLTISAGGTGHRHLNSFLVAGPEHEPAEGVYFTSIRVTSTGGAAASDPVWLVYNNGATPADFDRALDAIANPFGGDANYSGRVDIADFSILAANFNSGGERFWFDGDFNGDRAVNIGDFSILAANFNQDAPAPAPRGGAVPEPGAAAMLLGATLICRRRRCR
jgi:hypothetical protein